MSNIPPCSTQLGECSHTGKLTTTSLFVLSHTASWIWVIKLYFHDSYFGKPLSWPVHCFTKSLSTGSNKLRATQGVAAVFLVWAYHVYPLPWQVFISSDDMKPSKHRHWYVPGVLVHWPPSQTSGLSSHSSISEDWKQRRRAASQK